MRQVHYILTLKLKFGYNLMHNSRGGPMAHDTARVSPRLHQTHENWEASHDFPRFSDDLPNESEFPALATQLSRPILHPLPSPLFWTNQERCSSRMKHTILFKNKGRPIVGGLDGNGSISGRMGDGWGSEYPFS